MEVSNMFNAKKVKDEIVQWIQNYFAENGKESMAVIGISGGKDSSIVAALCVEALGKERVFGVLLPQGEQYDIALAYQLVEHLGIPHTTMNIHSIIESLYHGLEEADLKLNHVVKTNTPSRIRMAFLYAVAASVGGRVANTCNLSEKWIGWSTKFGDAVGDFSPLSDITATEVVFIGDELRLPHNLLYKVPEDGLTGKTDEENFGFMYATLDRYLRTGVCEDPEIKAKIDKMHLATSHKTETMPYYKLSGGM